MFPSALESSSETINSSLFGILLGTDYYVSPTGSDSNPGSLSNPFKTIQKAADNVEAGDVVNIMGGAYHEQVYLDNVDGSEGMPIIFKSYDVLFQSLKVFNEILKNVSPNKKRMLELAYSGYITATDLADYLVKNNSMSFRKAYQKTALLVNLAEKKKKRLNELSLEDLKKVEPTLTKDVLKVFDLKNSVNSKKSYGGTSFDNIKTVSYTHLTLPTKRIV